MPALKLPNYTVIVVANLIIFFRNFIYPSLLLYVINYYYL